MFSERFIDALPHIRRPIFMAENILHTINFCDYVVPVDYWFSTVLTLFDTHISSNDQLIL